MASDGRVGGAEGEEQQRGQSNDQSAAEASERAERGDPAVCARGNGAEVETCKEPRGRGGEDAEFGGEGIGGYGGVVADYPHDEEVAGAVGPAVCVCGVGVLGAEGELAGVQEGEDGGAEGVGEDLDVGAGTFAVGGAVGGEGEAGFGFVFDLVGGVGG